MVDWRAPEEIQKQAVVFTKFMHSLIGLYAYVVLDPSICVSLRVSAYDGYFGGTVYRYEWFVSLDFDWAFVTRKKKFRWPMVRLQMLRTSGGKL